MEDDEVSNNLKAKIAALKILRYRTMSHANSKNAVDISTPVLKLLATILDRGGSLAGNDAVEEECANHPSFSLIMILIWRFQSESLI